MKCSKKGSWLIILMLTLAVLGATNSLVFKIIANQYGEKYAFFLDCANNVMYIIMSGAAISGKLLCTDDITPEMRAFPQYKFMIMATLDAGGQFLSFLGAVYTPGQDQQLINQTLIPITMGLAFIILGSRYGRGEIIGAIIVLFGASLAVVPTIINPSKNASGVFKWWAGLLYFASNIPMAGSAIYKEHGFKNTELDCIYLTFWVSTWQAIVTFAYAPLQAVPGFGTEDGIPQPQIWSNLWDGTKCFFGSGGHTYEGGVSCGIAGLLLVAYSLTNFLYNYNGLLLTKAGSEFGLGAVLCSIAYATKVPLTNALFTQRFLMGDDTERFTVWSATGLVVVLIGFVMYIYYTNRKPSLRAQESSKTQPLLIQAGDGGAYETDDYLRTREESGTLVVTTAPQTTGEGEEDPRESLPLPLRALSSEAIVMEREPWGFHDRVVGVVACGTVGVGDPGPCFFFLRPPDLSTIDESVPLLDDSIPERFRSYSTAEVVKSGQKQRRRTNTPASRRHFEGPFDQAGNTKL